MNVYSLVYAFIFGALVALIVITAHLVVQALKLDYYDLGKKCRPLKTIHPKLYDLMYRAKQHAIRARIIVPGTTVQEKLISMYSQFQPDSRYIRLERNIAKLFLNNPDQKLSESQTASLMKVCFKDLSFLDVDPKPEKGKHFAVRFLLLILGRLIIPSRDGPTEPANVNARQVLKRRLQVYLESRKYNF